MKLVILPTLVRNLGSMARLLSRIASNVLMFDFFSILLWIVGTLFAHTLIFDVHLALIPARIFLWTYFRLPYDEMQRQGGTKEAKKSRKEIG